MGLMAVTAAGHATWALGVAKSMLDDVQELAATKFRMSGMASLASRPTFQKDLAHHVAAWRAARLLVLDVFAQAESAAAGGDSPPTIPGRSACGDRLLHRRGWECAQWAHLAAGTTSIRSAPGWSRRFRDIYAGTQRLHQRKVAMDAASVWLGIVDDQFSL